MESRIEYGKIVLEKGTASIRDCSMGDEVIV
jgi:hypothetical protein